jgi:flagellar biosynthesis/type III secretory pathway M-ring protein FliF/YscJ
MNAPKSSKKIWVLAGAAVVLLLVFGGIYVAVSRGLNARDRKLAPAQQAGTPAEEALRKARSTDVQKTLDEIRRMNAATGRAPTTLGDPNNQSIQRTLDEINRINQMNEELRKAQKNPAPPPPSQNR